MALVSSPPVARFQPNWPERGWLWLLGILSAVGFLGTAIVFSPGYISADAMFQLQQAMGRRPLTDWHPPAMSLLWRALIWLTGSPATMAMLQELVLWAALFVIAWCVWEMTGSRGGSLAVLGLGITPHILTFVGVVWKDVQMAFAFLAATAIAVLAMRLRSRGSSWRWSLFAVGLAFIVYGILVRKNAIFAALPVFVMLVLALWPRPRRQVWLVTAAALVAGLVVPSVAISAIAHPKHENQLAQVMVDDLLHVPSVNELRAAKVSPDLRHHLVSAAQKCRRMDSLSNNYWTCYGEGANGPYTSVAHPDQIQSLWITTMSRHIPGYLEYRFEVFSRLLFKTKYEYAGRVVHNNLGLHIGHPRLEDTLRAYVLGMNKDLPYLFSGALWLLLGILLSFRPGRGLFRMPIRAIGISSVVYIVGYLPVLPVNIYRYVYWPAIAGSLGLVLLWAGRRREPLTDTEAAAEASPQTTPAVNGEDSREPAPAGKPVGRPADGSQPRPEPTGTAEERDPIG